MAKQKIQTLTSDQNEAIGETLQLIAGLETPLTNSLMIWINGLRFGLVYHDPDEKQVAALEELDSLQALSYALQNIWIDQVTDLSRMTSDPEGWANALTCLEGGTFEDHDALEFAASSIASEYPTEPQDIGLGLYAVSLLCQTDKFIRRQYLEFAHRFRKSLGPNIPIDYERLFGPWITDKLENTFDTTGLHMFEQRLEAVRNEVDMATLRAIAAFHLWQACQLAKIADNPSHELRHLYGFSTAIAQNQYRIDILPEDLEKRLNDLTGNTQFPLPFIPWNLDGLIPTQFAPCEPLLSKSPSTFAAGLFTKNARLIYNELITAPQARPAITE